MVKRNIISTILIVLLSIPILFFQSCPISRRETANPGLQRPPWAVNKPGGVYVELLILDSSIEYNPLEGFTNTYPVICKSSIYTGEKKTYKVDYRILSSVVTRPFSASCNIEEAEYDPIKGNIFVTEKESSVYELNVPKGLEAIQNVNLIIEYNVSNLITKIKIPMTIRKPVSGTVSSTEVPIYYTASPVIPRSDRIKIDITSKGFVFYLDIVDAVGCFRGYKKLPQFKIGDQIKISVVAAGSNIDSISCTPQTITTFPTTIRCSIDLSKNKDIYSLFSSETGIYIEVNIDLAYSCSMMQSYTIPVIRQI